MTALVTANTTWSCSARPGRRVMLKGSTDEQGANYRLRFDIHRPVLTRRPADPSIRGSPGGTRVHENMGTSRQVPANRGLHLIDVNPATGQTIRHRRPAAD